MALQPFDNHQFAFHLHDLALRIHDPRTETVGCHGHLMALKAGRSSMDFKAKIRRRTAMILGLGPSRCQLFEAEAVHLIP